MGSNTVAFLKFARSITTFNFQPCLRILADQSAVFFRIGLAQIAISVAFAPSGWLKSWVRCISETVAYSDRIVQLLWFRYRQYRLPFSQEVGAEHLFTLHTERCTFASILKKPYEREIIRSRRLKETNYRKTVLLICLITARKRRCGKVMSLHLSVSHSVHKGVWLWVWGCLWVFGGVHSPEHTHTLDTPPGLTTTPPPDSIRSTSGRYTSYWNALLILIFFFQFVAKS